MRVAAQVELWLRKRRGKDSEKDRVAREASVAEKAGRGGGGGKEARAVEWAEGDGAGRGEMRGGWGGAGAGGGLGRGGRGAGGGVGRVSGGGVGAARVAGVGGRAERRGRGRRAWRGRRRRVPRAAFKYSAPHHTVEAPRRWYVVTAKIYADHATEFSRFPTAVWRCPQGRRVARRRGSQS